MINWKEATLSTNGISLNYHRSGGDRQPVVMLHGITDNGLCWSRLANELVDEFDLILVDARGHGKSDKPGKDNSYTHMADDVAGLITGLQLSQPVVIGHSMGAQTTSVFAARHPGLASKLILEDPPWSDWNPREDIPLEKFAADKKAEILRDRALSVDELTRRKLVESPLWDKSEFPAWSESKHQVDPDIYRLASQESIPYTETVPAISCPSLLITADPALGADVTPELARIITMLNPLFQVVHIPGAGHNIRRENFGQYLDAVQAFLKS